MLHATTRWGQVTTVHSHYSTSQATKYSPGNQKSYMPFLWVAAEPRAEFFSVQSIVGMWDLEVILFGVINSISLLPWMLTWYSQIIKLQGSISWLVSSLFILWGYPVTSLLTGQYDSLTCTTMHIKVSFLELCHRAVSRNIPALFQSEVW